MNKLDPFEELLRSKLQSNELEFDNSLWNSIEKELPKTNTNSKTYKYIGLSIVAIGITASIIYYNSVNKTDNNNVVVDEIDTLIENNKIEIVDEIIKEEVAISNTTNNDNVNIKKSNENIAEIKLVSENHNPNNNNIELEISSQNTEEVDNVKENEIVATENIERNFVKSDTTVPSLSIICNKTEICLGEELILHVNSDADFAYLWDFGDGEDDSNESKHVYSSIGEYKVKLKTSLKNNNDKFSYSNELIVTVNESPKADFIYKLRETNGMSIIDFEYITNDLPKVNWNFDDGSSSTEYNPSHRYNKKGNYLCSLTVSNIFGCSNTSEQTIFISNSFQLLAPNTFTPNGDGLNDYFIPEALKGMNVDFVMTVFDKNGNKVYETKNVNQGWNGFNYYSSEKCQQDSYVWIVKLVNNKGENEEYKGAILLLK